MQQGWDREACSFSGERPDGPGDGGVGVHNVIQFLAAWLHGYIGANIPKRDKKGGGKRVGGAV